MTDPRPLSAIADGADVMVFGIENLWYSRECSVDGFGATAGPFDSDDLALAAARAAGKTPYLNIPF